MKEDALIYGKILKKLLEPDTGVDFFPVMMTSLTYTHNFTFVSFEKSLPEVQDFYLLLLNDRLRECIATARKEILQKIPRFYENEKRIKIPESLAPIENVEKFELMRLYETIDYNEVFASEFKKNDNRDEDLKRILNRYSKKICREFDLKNKFITPIKMYILTGFVCVPSGVRVEISGARDKFKIIIDENVSKNTLLKHWESIEILRSMMPAGIKHRGYSYLKEFSGFYAMYKEGYSVKEIATGTPYSELDVRRIINKMKGKAKDK